MSERCSKINARSSPTSGTRVPRKVDLELPRRALASIESKMSCECAPEKDLSIRRVTV
jgi:hypothetical protein